MIRKSLFHTNKKDNLVNKFTQRGSFSMDSTKSEKISTALDCFYLLQNKQVNIEKVRKLYLTNNLANRRSLFY